MDDADLHQMRPQQLMGLLNSTQLGKVISAGQLLRHRRRAGLTANGCRTVDLPKYAAWLVTQLPVERAEPVSYDQRKERERQRQAAKSRVARDIAEGYREEVPVKNPARRKRATKDFRFFCETYMPDAFYLPWSDDHLKVIAKIERAVQVGSQFAIAMARGSGKTALTETAAMWAILTGARQYVCMIGATAPRGISMLDSIKTELECNDLIFEDFRCEVFAIRAMERIVNRVKGQTFEGKPTRIAWTSDKIIMPTMPDSKASGCVMTATGLEGGNIRGQKHKLASGAILRPDLAIIDDPQTTETAHSPLQSERREKLLAADVLGMAGPGKKISALMCATVIQPNDMADRILNRDHHPEWQGERTKMVYTFPTNQKLWDQYAAMRVDSLKADGDGTEATEFYRARQAQMDAGAVVAWPERYDPDELSALQHAMNLRIRDEAAFFAEYQNEPIPDTQVDVGLLTADQIAAKTNGRRHRDVPTMCEHMTMFIDVHDALLYFCVMAWQPDFTGHVVDYGGFPDQGRRFFTMRDARQTIPMRFPGMGREGSIQAALRELVDAAVGRQWLRDDGSALQIGRCLIDSGYLPGVVWDCIRTSGKGATVMPSKGVGVGASHKPFSEYRRKAGDRAGYYWRIPSTRGTRELRTVSIDTNFWKSFVHARLLTAYGDPGSMALFGDDARQHRMIGEHITAEYRVPTEGRGRKVDEWKARGPGFDNHLLDCVVGCAVAASMLGCTMAGMDMTKRRKRKRVRLSDLQNDRKAVG